MCVEDPFLQIQSHIVLLMTGIVVYVLKLPRTDIQIIMLHVV